MSEQKNDIPLVRLGDVATWLRAGDRFAVRTAEFEIRRINGLLFAVNDAGTERVFDNDDLVRLLSPRLELVPVGEVVKAGTPYGHHDGLGWSYFDPSPRDERIPDNGFYQLIRDEPELPREVIAGPDTLRVGDVVEFVRTRLGVDLSGRNKNGPHTIAARDEDAPPCWETVAGEYFVYDGGVVRLLSRANQDPPAPQVSEARAPLVAELQASEFRVPTPEVVAKCGPTFPVAWPGTWKPESCSDCGEPFWAGRHPVAALTGTEFVGGGADHEIAICGDCVRRRGPLDTRIATAHRELAESAPDPHAHLTPAQRYHLDDDPDTTGIPGGD